jgi:2-oxoisovalerate dehydrogenase E1 component
MTEAELLEAYRRMLLVRRVEERISELYRDGEIPGFVHSSIGQEACAVGATWHLRADDVITSTHRGHGHVLAKGLDPAAMLAELMGRVDGACRGRGGSMHVADPTLGIFGANGIVGAGLPIAVGAAHAAQRAGAGRVVVAFFGDGALSTGAFHEAVNLAALWRLPVVFFCENNGYSEFSATNEQQPVPVRQRAAGYGITFRQAAGNDVEAVAAVMAGVVAELRRGGGPVLVEATTVRVHGHYEGDPQRYRDPGELADYEELDPLSVARRRLRQAGVADELVGVVEAEVADQVRRAEAAAASSAEPDPASATCYVYAPTGVGGPVVGPGAADRPAGQLLSGSRIVRQALDDALADDPEVFLAGIDVGHGNVFGVTRGLAERYPGQVLDTPISETAIVGLGVGAAMAGLRPVVELMYLDFLGVCFDQLLNQAAKLRFMTGGAVSVPLVVRTQFASGRSSGSQHSQSLEALLAHVPGLKVVMPSAGDDLYGLLRSAVEDPNPVVVIEHRLLYEHKWPLPAADHRVPIGRARLVRPGRHVTVVSWSRMVFEALAAAEALAAEGIDVEVVDLRTIVPVDREAVVGSVSRTGRLVVAHEAVADFGAGAEIAASVAEAGFWQLDAPILRVGAPFSPAPYAPSLERAWQPGAAQIAAACRQVVRC